MNLFKRADDLAKWLELQKKEGRTIGFVPTMGALHAGHISLIDISKKSNGVTVCSIFVNPTQFNDPKDFQKYPVTLEKDIEMLETAGADALFLPGVGDMYPQGTKDLETYALGPLETVLEGKFRPGHFQGVCQVMRRLLDMLQADDLYMGQKDYQQCMVVRRLLEIMGSPTRLHPSPIIRETDGLAMSSRNLRLTQEERAKAPVIYQALSRLQQRWADSDTPSGQLETEAMAFLEKAGFRPDYVSVADPVTLEPVLQHGRRQKAVVLLAAFLGEIRLIDNMLLAE